MQGTSRGGADIKEIVKRIDMWAIDMVFVVGGNGGNAGANAIQEECARCGVVCSVIGVPKSIDNDILLVNVFFCCCMVAS
jgi:6-phosphofructokinase 1